MKMSLWEWVNFHKEKLLLVLLLGICLFLFLWNLGNQYLWQDEAQTALVSRSVLLYGVPKGTDGKNFFSQEGGAEYGENYLWKWHPWLPFYVLAGFFAVFGEGTFVARLPFALCGIGTVFLTYQMVKKVWGRWDIAMLAAGALTFCVPFLLLARQCRYYSMSTFFSMWVLSAYWGLLKKERWAGICFVVAATCLFNCHYIYCFSLFPAVAAHALLCHRNRVKILLGLLAIATIVNLPMGLWLRSTDYVYKERIFSLPKIGLFMTLLGSLILRYCIPPITLIILPFVPLVRWAKKKSPFGFLGEFGSGLLLFLLYIAFTVSAVALLAPYAMFRYLSPLVPLFGIFIALILAAAAGIHKLVVVAFVGIFLYAGWMNKYLYEITHDFDGPIEGIVKYLQEHGRDEDTVLITYGDLPVKFYTGMRVFGGATSEDLSGLEKPEWVIVRRYPLGLNYTEVVFEKARSILKGHRYQRIRIDYPDTAFENRESIKNHRFRTETTEKRVVIYKRIE